MIRYFNRHFWVVHLGFIVCAAWLASYLATVVIRDRLSTYSPTGPAKKSTSLPALTPEPYEKYSPVTDRNIFNPAERGMKLLPLEGKRTGPAAPGDGKNLPVSPPGNYTLLGTVAGPKGYSWAILLDKGTKKQQLFRVQGNFDGGKILSISRKKIEIERQGKRETLNISEETNASVPVKPASALIPPPPRRGEEVKKLAPNRYLVNREDVSAAVGDINQFMTQARLKPHFEAGKPTGYSVSEVVPGSLMEKLGLKNNDVIKKVNGLPISRPEEVMQAYAQLQRDSNIELEVERGGRSEVLRYEIR